jgi:hypothetical protein
MKKINKNNNFKEHFSEPAKLIALYNSLSGNKYPPDTPVEITTISEDFFSDHESNICFIIHGKIVVIIEQKTVNEDTPRKLLSLIANLCETIYESGISSYFGKLENFPRPEFFVLHNDKDFPDEKVIKLSDDKSLNSPFLTAYTADSEAKYINISKGKKLWKK